MKPNKPAHVTSLPASVTFINGKAHIKMEIRNTKLQDWVDKQEILTLLHISDRTLRTLRKTRRIPFAALGGKILYYLPGILFILEESATS